MLKDDALVYIKSEGNRPALSIFPCKGKKPLTRHGVLDATKDPKQVEAWWNQFPTANIAVATGRVNGLVVVDIDEKPDQGKFGEESLHDLEQELGKLPDTWTVVTGTGGLHLYFRYPEGVEIRNSASKIAENIDIRGSGGFVVAPPSIHPDTGRPYEWDLSPEDTELADLPLKWLQRIQSGGQKDETEAFELPEKIVEGKRNDTLFRYAAQLRAKRKSAIAIWKALENANDKNCASPVSEKELETIFNSVMRYPEGAPVDEIIQTEPSELKEENIDLKQFHLFSANGKASVYDFKIFQYLSKKENIFVLGGTPYLYRHGCFTADPGGARLKTEIRHLIYPELIKAPVIERVYKLFLSDARLQVTSEDLNQYPDHWVAFENAFFDPVSQKMIAPDPKYRNVNQIPHQFDPEARPKGENMEKWLRFIAPSEDDREMLLEFMGYCLTKDTRQQKFLILYGSGGTGKSTLIRLLELMIGADNISNISLKELTQRFSSYGLLGKLLNSCADLEVSALEDTSTIKKILGEDTIRAEAKGCDAFSFRNYARLIFSTNELPLAIGEKSNGFYRRLLILRMNRKPERTRTDLLDTLKPEIDYLIHLAADALGRMYQRGSILESEGSKEAVKEFRKDSDSVQAFLADECSFDKESRVDRGRLYLKYTGYCDAADRQALSRNNFFRSLRAKDFIEGKSGSTRFFKGIKLGKSVQMDSSKWTKAQDDEEVPFLKAVKDS